MLALVTRGFSGGRPPGLTLGLVANRAQVPTTITSIAANTTSIRHHYAHPDGDIYDIQTVDTYWYIPTTVPVAGGSRVIKRYIEYPAGVFHQVKWAGATTKTISSGSVKSDVVISSVTGLPLRIPAAAKFWERTVNLNATVASFPCIELPAASSALGCEDGNDVTDKGNSGTIAPTSTVRTFGAAAIYGKIAVDNARSFLVVGDSIAFGEGDITSIGPKGGSGWIARALDVRGYPYMKITRPGQQAADAASLPASPQALVNLVAFSDAIFEHGVNDLRLNRTKDQILADQQTLYAWANGARIWQTTISPRSSSTDAYATVAGQTAKTDGNMADLNPLNAAIRAKPANVFRVIEAADQFMTARDSGIWKAPPAETVDGTHPNSYSANRIGNALAASLEL